MKKFEVTQELMLLRDAILSAEIQGFDFESEACAKACARTIKDAVEEVKMMLTVDGKTSSETKEAECNMHSLIFYRTLMQVWSNEYLGKTLPDDVKYVCESLSVFGMRTYVECVQICCWQEFTKEILHSTSDRFQENLCIEILKTIASLDDEIILDIWNFSISNLVALWCVCGNNDDSDDDVEKRNNFIRTIINRSMEIVVPDLKFSFTIKLCDLFILACLKSTYSYVKNEKRTIAPSIIIEVLEAIIRILQSTNEVWSDELINKISSVQCYVTNDDQILSSVLMNFGPINYVNLWQEKVVRKLHELTENVNKYERISSDIRVVNSRQGGYEDALDYLVNCLKAEQDSTILACLLKNYDLLKPYHIHKIMQSTLQNSNSDYTKQMNKIIEITFCCWPLEIQDSFRTSYHQESGLQNSVEEDSYRSRLTTAINRLSSTIENELAIIEFSYLCFRLPTQTLIMLLNHAIESGRGDTISKIVLHLKPSCNLRTANGNTFLVQYFENKTTEQINTQILSNMLTFIKVLIEKHILDVNDLMTNLILPKMIPVGNCKLLLKFLQVVLDCGDETIKGVFCTVPPSIIAWQLSKLVHYCMTVTFGDVENIVDFKTEITTTIKLLTDCIMKNKSILKDHEICWLWTKHKDLKNVVVCYWHLIFISHNVKILYENKVRQLPAAEFLLSNCLPNSSLNPSLSSVNLKSRISNNNSFRIKVTIAVAQILPRMTADEVSRLINYLCFMHSSSSSKIPTNEHNDQLRDLTTSVSVVMDALILLSNASDDLAYMQHLKHVVQICLASIKVAVMDCNRTPLKSLPDVTLSLLICLCCNLATNMNEFYVETVKILILDLARELRSSVDVFYVDIAMKAIYSLNDPQLRDQTEMLLNV